MDTACVQKVSGVIIKFRGKFLFISGLSRTTSDSVKSCQPTDGEAEYRWPLRMQMGNLIWGLCPRETVIDVSRVTKN